VELNLVRHLVIDMSCIDKNLDMRLILSAKRKMTSLSEEEISNIRGLLDSATMDRNVKGGEIKREVALMLKDINTKLEEQNIERGCVMEMLKDALGTLWDFLHCDAYLT
ncbi:hypothetical protein AALP_AAs67030U000100, partial [Arabis alpina]